MIPVAADHAPHVIDRYLLPCLIANVLPSRNFFQHQQPHLVASIQKVPRLRIVRRAHDVALQIFSQDSRVAALRAPRHSLAHERKCLMSVQPAQFDDLPIQLEAVICKLRLAKTNRATVLIDELRALHQANVDRIKIRVLEIPKFDPAKILEMHRVRHWLARGLRRRHTL
jgi:hypothetical protein